MLLAGSGFLGVQYWQQRQAASLAVEHSRQVIDTLERLRANIADLEAERRAYLLTLDPAYLKPYGVSDESVRREGEALQTLVASDPLQSLRAGHLALTLTAKLREVDDIVKKARTSGVDPALATIGPMAEVRSQIDQMVDHERFRLVDWAARADALEQRKTWLIASDVVVVAAFAGAALAFARLEARRRRKATEENVQLHSDLEDREGKIRRLVDANIIGIFMWNVDGRITDANEAFLRMLGYGRDDLDKAGLRWTALTPAEWHHLDERAVAEARATGSSPPYEKEYFRKDGSRVPILIGGAIFESKRDEGVAFIVDMTERKQAEEKLRTSEQRLLDAQMELARVTRVTTLGELTASIAHEVNQPLAAVVANAEACLRWLDRGPPDLDAARRSVEWVIDDGNRAGEVIRRIRALANKTGIEKIPLDVNDVARETVALVQRELISHEVSLQMELAPALPMILADGVQLQQVIINLVMNGIEAMQSVSDRPRELVIRSLQDKTQEVLVSVTDCGVGIAAENADRLFNAFFTTKPRGMGMGLSICRSIMEAHNGRLWATANVPHGATFQFTLPVNADAAS
jgi:PAS domain S-box-containing protein